MNGMSEADISKAFAEAIEKGDSSIFDACVTQISEFCFRESQPEQTAFPEHIFDHILELMSREEFLQMDGSHNLLLLFEYDWARLTAHQKEKLLEAIRKSYDRFTDGMSYFVISELLGEYYCNEAAFRVLTQLQTTSYETARSLVPHGYEHIARDGESAALRKMSLDRLASMAKDDSPDVQREVAEAFANISAHQKKSNN